MPFARLHTLREQLSVDYTAGRCLCMGIVPTWCALTLLETFMKVLRVPLAACSVILRPNQFQSNALGKSKEETRTTSN